MDLEKNAHMKSSRPTVPYLQSNLLPYLERPYCLMKVLWINLSSLMQIKSINEMQDNLSEVNKQVADIFMQNTANEFGFSEVEGETDISIS